MAEQEQQQAEKRASSGRVPAEVPCAEAVAHSEAPRPEAPSVVRGRPGRRSAAEKRQAVLELLSGKASLDQVARQYGVSADTVAGWRERALQGIQEALAQGDQGSARERELAKENQQLREALSQVTVERALALKAVEEWKRSSRPSRPARSRR